MLFRYYIAAVSQEMFLDEQHNMGDNMTVGGVQLYSVMESYLEENKTHEKSVQGLLSLPPFSEGSMHQNIHVLSLLVEELTGRDTPLISVFYCMSFCRNNFFIRCTE